MPPQIDQERTKQFAGKLLGIYTGCALTKLIDIGHQTGLFDAGAKYPSTSQELAERTGLNERYVREWLGAMTTGGIFTYEPASQTYSLPPEHAALLCGDTAKNLAPMSQMLNVFGKNLPQLVQCFREGAGSPTPNSVGLPRAWPMRGVASKTSTSSADFSRRLGAFQGASRRGSASRTSGAALGTPSM